MAVVREREELGNTQLWEIMVYQEGLTAERFGIGVVGVGALFLAFATATVAHLPHLPDVIAYAGAGASFILWMHMYGSHKEAEAFRKLLSDKEHDPVFMNAVCVARAWRSTGRNLLFYQPVNRLMTYFTGLLTEAWIIIIAWRAFFRAWGVSFDTLFWSHAVLFLLVLVWYVGKRLLDPQHNLDATECDQREASPQEISAPISAIDNSLTIAGNTFVASPTSQRRRRVRKQKREPGPTLAGQ